MRGLTVLPSWAHDGLQEALDRNEAEESLREVQDRLTFNELLCWENEEQTACIVARLVVPARGGRPIMHVYLATGQMNAVLALADEVEAWARGASCAGMSLVGRRGWVRVLEDRGWQEGPAVFMEKRF